MFFSFAMADARRRSMFLDIRKARSQRICYTRRMTYLLIKALLSGALIAAASEFARRSPGLGGLVVSLPLVSLLAFIWLWRDTGDGERVAALSQSTFWFLLPSMPMFLALPALLRAGWGFWPSLALACGLAVALYGLTLIIGPRLGLRL